ncbi:transmembrane protein, putative [Medicago truncatula]|uniref:Transmembrane protein, putative n=1 Tax=Medicago truncatula TaxID=3880 RepID=A0A072VGB6_MEDTR|nr:transmembrane protein, putative [Medicago truncatula]
MTHCYTTILYSIVFFLAMFSFFTLRKTNGEDIPNVNVAQDGSGIYTEVMDVVGQAQYIFRPKAKFK